jgi:hypothetical protein
MRSGLSEHYWKCRSVQLFCSSLTIFQIELSSTFNNSSFRSHCSFLKSLKVCFTSNWKRFAIMRSMGKPVLQVTFLARVFVRISSTMCRGTVYLVLGSVERFVTTSIDVLIPFSSHSTARSRSSSVMILGKLPRVAAFYSNPFYRN